MGVFAGEGLTLAAYGGFLVWSVLENAVGGAVFVAGLKYGHVRRDSAA